jgi:hypothetical protein
MWNDALSVQTREMPKNDEYWALDHLKCILHDLLAILRPIRLYIAGILDNSWPQEGMEAACQTIGRGIRRINIFIEKAFPPLKENKSYLDIDWNNEFKNLEQ